MAANEISRRAFCATAAVASSAQVAEFASRTYDPAVVRKTDDAVDRILKVQITDPAHPRRGGYADDTGLYSAGAASGPLEVLMSAYLCKQSKHAGSALLVERMKLAGGYLEAMLTADGNIDNPTTNFNSPPDTAFVLHGVCNAARLAQLAGRQDLLAVTDSFLKRAGEGVAKGGVHTPNHRWVVCEALAQLDQLRPNPRYRQRIRQWLAEGIDIDADGQYNERSTLVYNPVTDKALVVTGLLQNMPELFDPVRKNLDSMLYLLHPGNEVVTEISRRQDKNERGGMTRYWFPLRMMAIRDGNGLYAALAGETERAGAELSMYMLYPQLSQPLPASKPLPDRYVKEMPETGAVRYRNGLNSATILLRGDSRFLSLRRGEAVVEAVRFSSAFFGKGQFVPAEWKKAGDAYVLTQHLEGPYYQPMQPPRKIRYNEYDTTRERRPKSEVCRMDYTARLREIPKGFELEVVAEGTNGVPLTIEVALRPGGNLEGCAPDTKVSDGWLLPSGMASYRVGSHVVRFGPGQGDHRYTIVRGALPKVPGTSVFVCGFTPFRKTLRFELG